MPKHKLSQDPAVTNAVVEISAYMRRHHHTQKYVESLAQVKQPQIAKILGGKIKKVSPDLMRLCDYAGIKLDSRPKQPHLDPRIQEAINKVWDGKDETIELIARLIECAGVVHGKPKDTGRERTA